MRAEKKERIFKAALSLIKKTGVHGMAMGQLSKDSGIPAGTFYHYFNSKEIMLQDMHLYCHKRVALVGTKAVKLDADYQLRFMNLVNLWYDHFAKYYVELYYIQESEAGYSVTNNSIRESWVYYYDVLLFLNSGVESKVLRNFDTRLMVQMIIQNIFSIIKNQIVFEISYSHEELAAFLETNWMALKAK